MSGRVMCPGILAALFASTAMVEAQEPCGPNDAVPWWPRWIQALRSNVAAPDRAAIEANYVVLEGIMKKTVYGTPRGYAVSNAWTYVDVQNSPRAHVWQYAFFTRTWYLCDRYEEDAADISIIFNPGPQEWSDGEMPDGNGDRLFRERIRTEPLFGSTATFGEFKKENVWFGVLFTAGGESPTIPVTREEFLKAVIFALEGKNGARLREAQTARRKSYQEWLDGAAERKKQNEQIVAMIAKQDPAQARAILVRLPEVQPALREQHAQMFRQFDWETLKRLLPN